MKPPFKLILAAGAVVCLGTGIVRADTYQWNTGDGTWDLLSENWTGAGTLWADGNDAVFNNQSLAITISGNRSASSVAFGDSGSNKTFSVSGGSLAVSGNITAQGASSNGAGGPVLDFNSDVTVTGDLVMSRRNVTISGGTFSVNRVLASDSWGEFKVSGGWVLVANGIDDSIVPGGNTLRVTLTGGTLVTSHIRTTGATFAGEDNGVTLNGGTLVVADASHLSNFIDTYDANGWGDHNSVFVGNGGANIDTNGYDVTINNTLNNLTGNTGKVNKLGAGSLLLSGSSGYSGVTDIQTGTLVAANNNALGAGGHNGATMTWIHDGATLALQGGVSINEHFHVWGEGVGGLGAVRSLSGNNALTDSYALRSNTTVGVDADSLTVNSFYQDSGSFGLTKVGAGALVLTGSSAFTGGMVINGGTVRLAAQDTLANIPVTVNSGGILESTADWGFGLNSDWGGSSVGHVTVNAGGTLRASSSANSIRNGLTLNGGTIDATVPSNPNWGNFELESNLTVGGTSTSTIASEFHVKDSREFNVNPTGDPSGIDLNITGLLTHLPGVAWGWVQKTGTGTMQITQPTGVGNINVNAGKLIFKDAGADTNFSGSPWGLGNSGVVEFNVTTGSRTFTPNISGSGSVTKVGAGTLVLSAVSAPAGGTFVNEGTLEFFGSGGWGRLWGNLTVNPGGTVVLTGDGTGLGFNDQIYQLNIIGGTVTAAGTSHVWNIAGGLNMTGGTLQSNNGVNDPGGPQLEWNRTTVNTNASPNPATIAGRIRMRGDNGYAGVTFNVADGPAANDLLVSAAVTQATGGLGITKDGAGTMTLTGSNTYSGATTILEGQLVFDGGTSIIGNVNGSSPFDTGDVVFGGTSHVTVNGSIFLESVARTPNITIQGNADVTVTGGIGVGNWGNGEYFLGGTLRTPSIAGSSMPWGPERWVHFDGTRVVATADNGNFVTLLAWDSENKVYLGQTGGAIFDTAGHNVGIQVNLVDEAGQAGKLVKDGAGTLTLTGNSSYTGDTTVANGTLKVTGSLGNTAVTVQSGATLAGTGSIGGSTSVDGTLAPGGSVGTISLTNLSLNAGSIFAWENSAANTLGSAGTDWDAVAVTGTTLIDGTAGTGAALQLLFTNTGTDFTNSFWNSSRAWNFITGGVTAGNLFDASNITVFIDGMQQGSNNEISGEGSFTTAVSGSNLQLVWTATVTDAYTLWAQDPAQGLAEGDRDPAADPDGDGANNLAEFAFKGNPSDPTSRGLIAQVVQDASAPVGNELTLVIAVRNGADFGSGTIGPRGATIDAVTYTVQGSTDLSPASWAAGDVTHVSGPDATAPPASGLTESLATAGWKYHTFKLNASEGLPGEGFLRAKVEK